MYRIIKPPVGTQINWRNPLARGMIGCWLFNENAGDMKDLVRRQAGSRGNVPWGTTVDGIGLQATSLLTPPPLTPDIIPTTEITIIIGFRKTDATNRESGAFGMINETTASKLCGCHCPYSDGTVYWDFGGSSGGSTRLSVGSLTVSGFNVWGFSAGTPGMQIWQNGVLRATQSGHGTRTVSTNNFGLGYHNTKVMDNAAFAFLFLYNRMLMADEQQRIGINPYGMFAAPPRPISVATFGRADIFESSIFSSAVIN